MTYQENQLYDIVAELSNREITQNDAIERILDLFTVTDKLPEFLYKNQNGLILIGYEGDSDATDEWSEWKESIFEKPETK
jgi:hypothetical protein